MTTRYKSLTVILEEETREDDLDPVIMAISMIRGVHSVEPRLTDTLEVTIAEGRVRAELSKKLWDVLRAEKTH